MQDILESGKRLRVAAYCRVSTAKEEQESSYEIQVAFFKEMIAYHPNWEMTEVYADYGITGTSVEKRKGFSRMIEDCKGGKIDLILVKSLSRFARNTLDSLNCIRMINNLKLYRPIHNLAWICEIVKNTIDHINIKIQEVGEDSEKGKLLLEAKNSLNIYYVDCRDIFIANYNNDEFTMN